MDPSLAGFLLFLCLVAIIVWITYAVILIGENWLIDQVTRAVTANNRKTARAAVKELVAAIFWPISGVVRMVKALVWIFAPEPPEPPDSMTVESDKLKNKEDLR